MKFGEDLRDYMPWLEPGEYMLSEDEPVSEEDDFIDIDLSLGNLEEALLEALQINKLTHPERTKKEPS